MIYATLEVYSDEGQLEDEIDIYLNDYLDGALEPEFLPKYSDYDLSETLVLFNEAANKLLMEAQRRGILQEIMDSAMKLQGAPKG